MNTRGAGAPLKSGCLPFYVPWCKDMVARPNEGILTLVLLKAVGDDSHGAWGTMWKSCATMETFHYKSRNRISSFPQKLSEITLPP